MWSILQLVFPKIKLHFFRGFPIMLQLEFQQLILLRQRLPPGIGRFSAGAIPWLVKGSTANMAAPGREKVTKMISNTVQQPFRLNSIEHVTLIITYQNLDMHELSIYIYIYTQIIKCMCIYIYESIHIFCIDSQSSQNTTQQPHQAGPRGLASPSAPHFAQHSGGTTPESPPVPRGQVPGDSEEQIFFTSESVWLNHTEHYIISVWDYIITLNQSLQKPYYQKIMIRN